MVTSPPHVLIIPSRNRIDRGGTLAPPLHASTQTCTPGCTASRCTTVQLVLLCHSTAALPHTFRALRCHSTAAHLPRARTPIRRHYAAALMRACNALHWRCAELSQRTTSGHCPATPLPHTFRAREPPSATGNTLRCHNPHSPPAPHCLNGSGIPFPSIGTLAAPLHRQWTATWA